MLTKTQKQAIEYVASLSGEVSLFKEPSLSGKSETLRYQRRWIENGRYGPSPRSQSGMILSVKIHEVRGGKYGPNWIDDPRDIEKFNLKCKEAQVLFAKLRVERNTNA